MTAHNIGETDSNTMSDVSEKTDVRVTRKGAVTRSTVTNAANRQISAPKAAKATK